MRLGGVVKWFKLVNWYLNFFHVWAASASVFFAYIYLYDRFTITHISTSPLQHPGEGWHPLILAAHGLSEPLVVAVHAALVSAVLFSFEEGEGLSYVRHAFGVSRTPVYMAKIAAGVLLVSTPYAASKVAMAIVWDYRLLAWFTDFLIAALAVYAAAMLLSSYLISLYSFWSLAVGRPLYFIVGAFLEAYLMETLFSGPLMLMPITFTVLQNPYATVQQHWIRFTIALIHACAAYVLQLRGEVKWR